MLSSRRVWPMLLWYSWRIHNESKRTISVSGGFELLQMVSESDTIRVLTRMLAPKGEGRLWDPTSIGGRNEAYEAYVIGQNGQYLLVVDLCCFILLLLIHSKMSRTNENNVSYLAIMGLEQNIIKSPFSTFQVHRQSNRDLPRILIMITSWSLTAFLFDTLNILLT